MSIAIARAPRAAGCWEFGIVLEFGAYFQPQRDENQVGNTCVGVGKTLLPFKPGWSAEPPGIRIRTLEKETFPGVGRKLIISRT